MYLYSQVCIKEADESAVVASTMVVSVGSSSECVLDGGLFMDKKGRDADFCAWLD